MRAEKLYYVAGWVISASMKASFRTNLDKTLTRQLELLAQRSEETDDWHTDPLSFSQDGLSGHYTGAQPPPSSGVFHPSLKPPILVDGNTAPDHRAFSARGR